MTPAVSLRVRFAPGPAPGALVAAAEDLGLHGVWVNEPWGFDAGAVLGWVAATTRRVLIGTHIISVYARTPAATAGLAGALQVVSEGRFRLGLGTSGPQVVEGWHGLAFDRPLARSRDTVAVVRAALAGDVVEHRGEAVTLPLPGSRGKALRFSQLDEPLAVPVYLAALGPANQRLTAEVADGWTPTPYSPDHHQACAGPLLEALAETGRQVALAPVCPLAVGDDVEALLELERGWSAFYLGGMGTPKHNFYANVARVMGRGAMVERVARAWRAGDRSAARAAVDADYADAIGLFGPPERIRERLARYAEAGVDELAVELRKPDPDDQLDDLRRFWKVVAG
jgi:F420-dependent oxidoreductase-like protein